MTDKASALGAGLRHRRWADRRSPSLVRLRLKPAASVCVRIFRVANSTASHHSLTRALACLCSRGE
jgi:hypothetical protein